MDSINVLPHGGNKQPVGATQRHTMSAHFQAILRDAEIDPREYLRLINNCDEHDPLLSETPLGQRLASVPLDSLNPGELGHLQLALNVEQLIPTANGLARDYRGLAELMHFSSLELESRFKRSHNPTKSLLDAYVLQSRLRGQQAEASVNHLLKLLESIERFDIIDDLLPQLVNWATTSSHAQVRGAIAAPNQQNNHISQQNNDQHKTQPDEPLYDAFVCFAPEDFPYAQELIRLLEAHNRRLVTVDNLLPGRFEYDAIVQMIATECRKVIVILTPNYLLSKDCDFQTKFANELAIKSGWNPRLIPVLCEPLDDTQLPYLLRFMSKIDMTPRLGNQPAWQLKKLLFALDHDNSHSVATAGGSSASFASYLSGPVQEQLQQQQLTSGPESQGAPRHSINQNQNHESDADYYQDDSRQPIVDLAYSQTGSTSPANLNSGLCLMTSASTRVSTPSGWTSASGNSHAFLDGNQAVGATPSMNPLNWYKSIKQRVRGFRSASESGMSPSRATSLSSRANLLPPGDSDDNLSTSGEAMASENGSDSMRPNAEIPRH